MSISSHNAAHHSTQDTSMASTAVILVDMLHTMSNRPINEQYAFVEGFLAVGQSPTPHSTPRISVLVEALKETVREKGIKLKKQEDQIQALEAEVGELRQRTKVLGEENVALENRLMARKEEMERQVKLREQHEHQDVLGRVPWMWSRSRKILWILFCIVFLIVFWLPILIWIYFQGPPRFKCLGLRREGKRFWRLKWASEEWRW